MKNSYLSILVVSMVFLMSSCYYDNFKELKPQGAIPTPCDSLGIISYSAQIVPILNASCNQNCHNPIAGVGTGNGDRDLTNYAEVSAATNDGTLSAGDWGPLYGTVSWDPNYGNNMPRNGSKISECDIAKIRKWAAAGAPNN